MSAPTPEAVEQVLKELHSQRMASDYQRRDGDVQMFDEASAMISALQQQVAVLQRGQESLLIVHEQALAQREAAVALLRAQVKGDPTRETDGDAYCTCDICLWLAALDAPAAPTEGG